MLKLAMLLVVSLTAVGCSSSHRVVSTGPVQSYGPRCGQTRVFLSTGGVSHRLSEGPGQVLRLTVRVGDVLRLRATGNCGWTVSATPQNYRLQEVKNSDPAQTSPKRWVAVAPGVVDFAVAMPSCAAPKSATGFTDCIGGINDLGTARVTVMP